MRRFNLLVIFLTCPMVMFGQLKIQSNGVFKMNNILVGNTGYGSSSVSFGYGALSSPSLSGSNNTANGYNALYSNTTGSENTANGYQALYINTAGSSNTAIGYWALISNYTGSGNTAIGYWALRINSTGNGNTAVGSCALDHNNANYNTAYGFYALFNNSTGNYNTAVGYNANGEFAADNLNNATAIGYNATNTASNQVRIGNSSVTSIGGYTNWTTISDGRAKKNIRAEVPGLAFINLLQPVTYNLDLNAIDEIQKSDDPTINHLRDSLRMAMTSEEREILEKARANKEKQVYSGFVAQDVEKAAQSVGYNFSGVDAPKNEKGTYGLRYAEFVVPLVKAVQELSEQNNRLQEQIDELSAKLDELTNAPKSSNVGVTDGSDGAKSFLFSIFPNPTNGMVTIDYTLYADAPISIELYNMYGQRVKLIAPKQNQKAGAYSIQTSVAGLVAGTYIVKVTSGNQVESKQLVIN